MHYLILKTLKLREDKNEVFWLRESFYDRSSKIFIHENSSRLPFWINSVILIKRFRGWPQSGFAFFKGIYCLNLKKKTEISST